MTRLSLLCLAAGGLAACAGAEPPTGPSPVPAVTAATVHTRIRQVVDEEQIVTNPCNGEQVRLHVRQLFVLHEVTIEGKAFHGHLTFLDRGTRGVGLSTGAVYHQVGAEQDFLHQSDVGVQERIHNTLSLISRGSVPNFQITEVFRIKVTPSGAVTLQFDKLRQECRG
jgi:hypothetical protein